ncbi:MAG: formyltransferase [Burkholderiaceae bacterium]|nr:formyltransferase [Burkholderiaceae bacterium]
MTNDSSPKKQCSAVVFAYHSMGVHCIKTLLAKQIDIVLVLTHEDSPSETIWFESVANLCQEHGIRFSTTSDVKSDELLEKIKTLAPDFIFSFYYRHMLPTTILATAAQGAYNLHGSLLPKYRGRVPVNWAVLHGETETGVTLHQMVEKPDAGKILEQRMVPILPDDTAFDVFNKLTVAAEQALWHALPQLINGTSIAFENNLRKGSYFGGRKPEDGRIDWAQTAQQVYNLHRAVAPPYPGAFTELRGSKLTIVSARLAKDSFLGMNPGLKVLNDTIFGICGDGKALHIKALLCNDKPISAENLALEFAL